MFGCKSLNLKLISDEVPDKYIQAIYGKSTSFEVRELSNNYLMTIKLRLTAYMEIMKNDYNNEEKYKEIVDNELQFSERQYYALIIISNGMFAYNSLDLKLGLLDDENNSIPGKVYVTEDLTSLFSQGICRYYFVFKAEKPVDQNIGAKLVVQFPNGKTRVYKKVSIESTRNR
jgi:hypothetical protein